MPRPPRSYQLTPAIVASSVGAGVLCLAAEGYGRTYRLHAERPGAHLNRRVSRSGSMRIVYDSSRADLPSGAAHVIEPVAPKSPLIRVDMFGPLEQRAGYHDPCAGWTDGHDAVSERLCAAFAEGDAIIYCDGPGGDAAGIQQGVGKALAAKAKYGRRCTGWITEQCGSAHAWWILALCDEVFLPPMAQIGSIGARGAHVDISGALAKEGVKKTYFADPPDKVALAPEFPLSEVGAFRAARDVKIGADAFRAAVCAGPLGVRHGLTPEALIAIGADMLTGQAAVAAGLADGVASEEEVTAYALRMAEQGAKGTGARALARGDRTMPNENEGAHVRAGDDPPEDEAAGAGIPTACAGCGVENPVAAKFCMGCGASMATKPIAEQPDEPPPSSRPMPGAPSARLSSSLSFAELLGLPVDASVPAQKAAMLDLRQVFDHAAKVTGQRTPDRIIGGLNAISHDAAQSGRLRAERNAVRAQQEIAERWALCERLVVCGGKTRGEVFKDHVNADGSRKMKDGKPVITLQPIYEEMRLGTLRGEVECRERNAAPRDPFKPDWEAAETAALNAKPKPGEPTPAQIAAAKTDPVVLAIMKRSGNTLSLDEVAKNHARIQLAGGVQ